MTADPQWQEIYEYGLVPAIFGPWSKRTVALAVPTAEDAVLDIACGTGVVTRLAAQYVGPGGSVVGLDANPGMIEVARSQSVNSDISIDWKVGDALMLPFPEATFQIVFCQGGLQFITDRLTVLREMYRVLKPQGKLALMVCQEIQHCPGFAIVTDTLARYTGWQTAALLRTPFTLGDAQVLRSLMAAAGFQNITIRPEVKSIHFPSPAAFTRYLITGSSIASQVDDATMTRLIADVEQEMQQFVKNGELSFPMGVNLAVAHR